MQNNHNKNISSSSSSSTEKRRSLQQLHQDKMRRHSLLLPQLSLMLLLLLLELSLTTNQAEAARRSRIDLATTAPTVAGTAAFAAGAGATSDNLVRTANGEELIPVIVQQPPSFALADKIKSTNNNNNNNNNNNDVASALASASSVATSSLKHDQSSNVSGVSVSTAAAAAATSASALGGSDIKSKLEQGAAAAEKSAAANAAAVELPSSQLLKEQKQRPAGEDIDFESILPDGGIGLGLPLANANGAGGGSGGGNHNNIEECDPDMLGFEIVTGYVFSAPGRLLDSLPGTLMLTDCLEACQSNETCQAVNYETGLCVLFSSNADRLPGALTKSQFPVFTIYAQKSCLGVRPCARAWCVDRVQNYRLIGHAKRSMTVTSRRDCLELCLGETEFTCRSANYYRATNTCELSEMDRITLAGTSAFQAHDAIDYLENNCAEEPNKLCEFKRLSGRILKTVDSVYQDVGSIDECRDLCLNSPYRCHSYDYGDTGDMVCRLSHHSRATLSDVQDPYLEVPEAATYELSSCYNVTIECGAGDMVARIRTSKLFDGKVYAKGSPKSCAVDVKSALDFELRMGYQDLECNIRQSGSGRYLNDVVIQHHDTIVTSSDLGLAVTCQYDLTNKTVTNDVDLGVKGDIEPALSEEVIVDSPNVLMKITSRDGSDIMRSAEVGDPLALKFEIMDEQSPYEIFVRELVAMDGADNAEITLIDSHGCPTDHFIMGPIYKSSLSGKILLSHFDAFKFPSSEVVQFRALVTPCMPSCEPVQCDQEDVSGEFKSLISYGRRRRRSLNVTATFTGQQQEEQQQQLQSHRRARRETTTTTNDKPSQEDLLLVQSIQITDKFGFDKQQQLQNQQQSKSATYDSNEAVYIASDVATATTAAQGFCVNAIGLVVAATAFLLAQLAVIAIWTYLYQRRRKQQPYMNDAMNPSTNYTGHSVGSTSGSSVGLGGSGGSSSGGSTIVSNMPNARTESLCKLYESGFAGRHHGRQF